MQRMSHFSQIVCVCTCALPLHPSALHHLPYVVVVAVAVVVVDVVVVAVVASQELRQRRRDTTNLRRRQLPMSLTQERHANIPKPYNRYS
jgi:undecaprenyl pyrophosphate phosphatase UppP